MSTSLRHLGVPLTIAIALLWSAVARADKLDLDRITPVPGTQQIPATDFFRDPFLKDPVISPSGKHVAAIVAAGEDHTKLMLYELATKKINAIGGRANTAVEWPFWLDGERLAFGLSYKKNGAYIMCGLDVAKPDDAYPVMQNIRGSLIAVPPADRLHPLVHIGRETPLTGKYGEVMTIDAKFKTGKIMDVTQVDWKLLDDVAEGNVRRVTTRYPILETPDGFDLYYLADKEGKLAYGVSSTAGVHTLHRFTGDGWKTCPENLDEIELFGVGDNPEDVVVLAPRSEGKPRPLVFMNAVSGKAGEVLFQDPNYDFNGSLYRDAATHLIVGAHFDRAGPQVIWFTESYRTLQKAIDGLFPGMVARIIGTDDAGKVVLVNVYSDRQPSIFRWVDLTKRAASDIQNSRPWIDPQRMQPMNVMKFKTRDGHKLDAYVTMPANATKQNPPALLVLPPAYGRATWGYQSEVQFFASRGYAVLQPNYRSLPGYNWMFPVEDEWDFRKMAEDVNDAVKALLASGLVDRGRVAVVGTSFAGFLALHGAAFEPSLYQCVVGISAESDWGKSIQDEKYAKYKNDWYNRMVRKLGDPKKAAEKFDAISPLNHASAIRASTLLVYGEYDPSDVISRGKELVSQVRRNNVPAETLTFANEAEGVHQIAHKVELYTKIETFLAEHLVKVGAPVATSP